MTEKEIIKGCKAYKAEAQKKLVEIHAGRLKAICRRYTMDITITQDALQETFINIFSNIEKYKPIGSFEGWLNRIAVTTSLKYLRSRKKINGWIPFDEAKYSIDDISQMEADDIVKVINGLPEHERLIFNMFLIEGYSHKEIAETLNIKESTSRSRLTRARHNLKNIFKLSALPLL